jgi:serine/threonine-protein kinase HipA
MKRGRADALLDEVVAAVRRWPEFADRAGLAPAVRDEIARHHRLEWPPA